MKSETIRLHHVIPNPTEQTSFSGYIHQEFIDYFKLQGFLGDQKYRELYLVDDTPRVTIESVQTHPHVIISKPLEANRHLITVIDAEQRLLYVNNSDDTDIHSSGSLKKISMVVNTMNNRCVILACSPYIIENYTEHYSHFKSNSFAQYCINYIYNFYEGSKAGIRTGDAVMTTGSGLVANKSLADLRELKQLKTKVFSILMPILRYILYPNIEADVRLL